MAGNCCLRLQGDIVPSIREEDCRQGVHHAHDAVHTGERHCSRVVVDVRSTLDGRRHDGRNDAVRSAHQRAEQAHEAQVVKAW